MPNKTVLFHTSENGDVSVHVQRTSHKGAPHARSEVDNLQREGHTTNAKGQGTEIEYMHKAVKWNRMRVQVQRTSLAE